MNKFPLNKNRLESYYADKSVTPFSIYLSKAGYIELCSFIVLLKIDPKIPPALKKIEQMLAQLINNSVDVGLADLRKFVANNLSESHFNNALAYLAQQNIELIPGDSFSTNPFLDDHGKWKFDWERDAPKQELFSGADFNVRSSRSHSYTEDQARILQVVLANPEESMDIQGFAGTGKTHIIGALVESLPKEKILLCAANHQQLLGLKKRIDKNIRAKTFGQLAQELLYYDNHANASLVRYRMSARYSLTYSEIATKLGLFNAGADIVPAIQKCLINFCYSADSIISSKHIPRYFNDLSDIDRTIVVSSASQMWTETLAPQPGDPRPFPLRQYHIIKELSLSDKVFPAEFSHIIVDEAHDLSPALLNIIDRSPQSILTFGDDFQVFQRRKSVGNRRSKRVRRRDMALSYRAGAEVETIYNDVLSCHPSPSELQFQAAKSKHTDISFYDNAEIPEKPTAILSKNSWHVFNVLQRLLSRNAKVFLLDRCRTDLAHLMSEAIDLFNAVNKRFDHPYLRNTASWHHLVERVQDPLIEKIGDMFKKGFDQTDLDRALSKTTMYSDDFYVLGRIEDSKNHEFNDVMLLSDSMSGLSKTPGDRALLVNNLYTGISRAKHGLILPAHLTDWLKDLYREKLH